MTHARWMIIGLALVLVASAGPAQDQANLGSQYENLARGKPYVLHPKPNYQYTRNDPHALTRLTDGEYTDVTKGQYWIQPTTVGWAEPTVEITLDLGEDRAIRGLSFGTVVATGTDVELPSRVDVLVSANGRQYHLAGDLAQLDQRPRPAGYNLPFRLQTDELMVHGRYVKLIVHKGGRLFIFCDEIEVYRGPDAWVLDRPMPGPAIDYAMTLLENPFSLAVKARLDQDLRDARAAVERAPEAVRARLLAEADAIQKDLDALPELRNTPGYRAVFPLNAVHARTFALYGKLRQAAGRPGLVAWRANPWDYLHPAVLPAQPPAPQVQVAALRGESRAGALNLTNCTARDLSVGLSFKGLPGGARPPWATVREVAWTDTFNKVPIAAALPEAAGTKGGWTISVPAGMTRQVWFEVAPGKLKPGKYAGQVMLTGAAGKTLAAAFALRVFNLDPPARIPLHLSGFQFTDRPSSATAYGVTHENVAALIAHLRARHVDCAWASTWAMPQGSFKDDGTFAHPPDAKLFDEWIAREAGAAAYYVYVFAPFWKGQMGGTGPGEPLFGKKMGEWARFWADHAREKGVLDRLWLVPVDEPHERSLPESEMFIAWGRAIKAAVPEMKLWIDPYFTDPTKMPAGVREVADAVSPNFGQMIGSETGAEAFYRNLQRGGKRLEFYTIASVTGDPYADYRLPAWWAFDLQAQAIHFWCFSDAGAGQGGSSWNPYAADRICYTPMFLDGISVTPGKHLEALREGMQDHAILAMLRDRVARLAAANPRHPQLPQARKLLTDGVKRVIRPAGAAATGWKEARDRGAADAVRGELAEILEKLR